jgi:hypothetical protein
VTIADVAHTTTTFFFVAHQRLNQRHATIKIVQLHGKAEGLAQAIASDGTTAAGNESAVSVVFAQALADALHQRVDACQAPGTPEVDLCGTQNAESRLVNNPGEDVCTHAAAHASGRFLHIEQNRGLGMAHPDQVGAAIRATW